MINQASQAQDVEARGYAGEGIYRENIMDHYRNPRGDGKLEEFDVSFRDTNPICGDEVEWFVKLANGKIEKAGFAGRGCAISQAASSMVAEGLEGKEAEEVIAMDRGDVLGMLGVELSATRVKCALLGLRTLQKALLKSKAGENDKGDNR